jgi:hypothetical protein
VSWSSSSSSSSLSSLLSSSLSWSSVAGVSWITSWLVPGLRNFHVLWDIRHPSWCSWDFCSSGMLVTNNQPVLHNIPEEWNHNLHIILKLILKLLRV